MCTKDGVPVAMTVLKKTGFGKWETFQPIGEVVRMVHEYSLKPSSFTKWVRPLRRTPAMKSKIITPQEKAPA